METYIEVKNLYKCYGSKEVIKGLSFCVNKGTVFGLLGHNGAGKSTLIDCILGLNSIDSGQATILGKEAKRHRKELFENIGVQLQNANYQNDIKVFELCKEISCLYKQPKAYEPLLSKFGLLDFKNQKVANLSGGEKQKLSVLLALIPNPQIVFLDELTTGLDVVARQEVYAVLLNLKQEGLSIFLTTHYMEEAQNLCDEVLLLKKGRKVVQGQVDEIIEKSPYKTLEEAYLWYMGEK